MQIHGLLKVRRLTHDLAVTEIHIFYSEHRIGFQLRRWAVKIMSFMISTTRLFMLTQSRRLHELLQGEFYVEVLPSPVTTPYRCNLSSENIKVALDSALAETLYFSTVRDQDRESFVKQLQKKLNRDDSEVVRRKPTLHAELAMIRAMAKGEIEDFIPYIGVSKLSCLMCSHYIHIYKELTNQKIATKGSHGKAYPGWFWPSLPDYDQKLRPAFMRAIQQQLRRDFEEHIATKGRPRQNSNSSVGSDFPGLSDNSTAYDGLFQAYKARYQL